MKSVLVPTGYDPASYSCVRSLSAHGVRTIVASEHRNALARSSRYCDEFVELPSPEDDFVAYKDALLSIASRPEVRTIVPIRAPDPYVLSRYRDEFEEHVSLVVPTFETLERVHDRMQLAAAAEAAGVPVPETRSIDEVDDWESEQIVKSRYNVLAGEYCDSYSARDFDTAKGVTHLGPGERPDVDAISAEMDHTPIVQEYVDSSDEYLVGALCDHGEPLATFQHRQIRGDSYTGGGGVYRRSVAIPELESVARRLLEQLDWHGLACIEYMKDSETGEFTLTEINPRLWQSLACAVRAGADFPYYYWLQAIGRSELIDPTYESGVGSHLLYGELDHLLSVLNEDSSLVGRPSVRGTTERILRSCYECSNFDIFRLDDPLVFVAGLKYVLKSNLRRVRRSESGEQS